MHDLLEQLEREARKHSEDLETAGQLAAGFTERHYPLTLADSRELRRLKAALAAATDTATFVALARGEPVPIHRLNQRLVDHYYRRVARGS